MTSLLAESWSIAVETVALFAFLAFLAWNDRKRDES